MVTSGSMTFPSPARGRLKAIAGAQRSAVPDPKLHPTVGPDLQAEPRVAIGIRVVLEGEAARADRALVLHAEEEGRGELGLENARGRDLDHIVAIEGEGLAHSREKVRRRDSSTHYAVVRAARAVLSVGGRTARPAGCSGASSAGGSSSGSATGSGSGSGGGIALASDFTVRTTCK